MLEDKVLNTINKYNMVNKNDKIVVGVSGGPDSVSLLYILYNLHEKLNIKIYVAHINHMIRKEADEESEYVRKICEKLNVEFYMKKVDVQNEAKRLKLGTEEAGRNIRYEFFVEILQKVGATKIATAHNSNDNAETVLMNIIRGTSVSGLKGIEKVRDGKYIRPLIECPRQEIEEYCEINNLQPKYDQSNNDNIYTRNKIRNLLIPYLQKEFNPSVVDGINRLSSIAAEEEQFINKIVENEYNKLLITADRKDETIKDNQTKEMCEKKKQIILDLKGFNKLDKVIKSKLILYTISKAYGTTAGIEKIHIEDIIKLCNNNIGNKFLVPKKGIKIYVKKGKIFFIV